MVRAGSLEVLLSLLKTASYDTIGAAVAALRNLSIHDSNAVRMCSHPYTVCVYVCISAWLFFALCTCSSSSPSHRPPL